MYFLKRELQKVKNQAAPNSGFKKTLWKRLNPGLQVDHWGLHLRLVLVPIFALVLFLSIGTGVYAYESPAVGEGHPLFRLKQTIERIERSFYRSPESRIQFEQRIMRRREAELRHRLQLLPPEIREEIMQRIKTEPPNVI